MRLRQFEDSRIRIEIDDEQEVSIEIKVPDTTKDLVDDALKIVKHIQNAIDDE